jgi:hypothetical protein
MFARKFFLLLGLVALIGCDVGPVNAPPEDADEPYFELRLMLQDAADTGMVPSDFADATEYIEQMKEADPTKAEAIAPGIEALQGLTDPEEVKAKAQEILSQL